MPSPQRYFFSKEERLCGKRAFDYLFKQPSVFRKGALKIFYKYDFPEDLVAAPISFGIVAPKRYFKKAVDRNLLKRRMREAVRLNKDALSCVVGDKKLVIFIKFESPKIASFADIEKEIIASFVTIKKKIEFLQKQ